MIVGENARSDEMDVNPTKEKKLTNMRAVGLRRHRCASCRRGRCRSSRRSSSSPTTSASRSRPHNVRLRKVVLDQSIRGRARSNAKHATRD